MIPEGNKTIHCVEVSPDDSDHIFELLDSERVSERWPDGESAFTAEIQSFLERILRTSEKVRDFDAWMAGRGYLFTDGQGDLKDYMAGFRNNAESIQLYTTMFPNLANGEDPEEDVDTLEAEVNFVEDEETQSGEVLRTKGNTNAT